jgi:hypothetical protein
MRPQFPVALKRIASTREFSVSQSRATGDRGYTKTELWANCAGIYRKAKFADLPADQSPGVSFMATTFQRSNKNMLPVLTAWAWLEIG